MSRVAATWSISALLFGALIATTQQSAAQNQILFFEDFEGVELNPIVTFGDSDNGGEIPSREAWSDQAPTGWQRADTIPGSPIDDGVREFRGWTFVDDEWWTATSGDQNRSAWDRGYGTVAVADNDEFDDFSLGVGEGRGPTFDGCDALGDCFDATVTTPSISLSGVAANSARLVFDSSYRPEHAQDSALEVSYDNGATFQRVFTWLSTNSLGQESFWVQVNSVETIDGMPSFDADLIQGSGPRPEGGFFVSLGANGVVDAGPDGVLGLPVQLSVDVNGDGVVNAQDTAPDEFGPDGVLGTADDLTDDSRFESIADHTRIVPGAGYTLDDFGGQEIIDDNTQLNQVIDVPLNNPAGATSVQVRWNMLNGGNDWWWAVDNVAVYTGESPDRDPALKAVVDVATGEVKIVNETIGDVEIRGYQILSEAGAFNEDAVDFQSDSDGNWQKLTEDGSPTDISEGVFESVSIAQGDEINLCKEADGACQGAYMRYSGDSESITFSYLIPGEEAARRGLVELVGNGDPDFAFPKFDLNYDGVFDILDWETFLAITDTADLSALSRAQAYNKGDLNEDGRLGVSDFVAFQSEYNRVFGAAAFSRDLALMAVPEPSTSGLLILAAVASSIRRRGLKM